ncbi:hypothetical protein LCGC14_0437430 [marine sediment metagenome]|uniref:Uncharacterized protein n=1 Tax=marine sediment metagenome TaxID=412755 RepID=A0A0F9T4P9_9ZZZZ
MDLLNACRIAQTWFEKMTNNEFVWEEQPSADMATIMSEAIIEAERQGTPEIEYGDCKECKHNVDCPHKPKPLAQYLAAYLGHEIENGLVLDDNMIYLNSSYNSWHELFKQALDAYQSTENVTIKIERNV